MKLERLEVRLRPKNSAEMELIEALEAQDGNYGGKNELMRECLRRGYTALKQKMESLSGEGDEIAALDALAQAFASGDYGYRVVKTYLNSRNQHSPAALPVEKVVPPSNVGAVMPIAVSVMVPEQIDSAQDVPPAVIDALISVAAPPVSNAIAVEAEALPPIESASEDVPADRPKRVVDWTKMRGLAGSGDEGGAK